MLPQVQVSASQQQMQMNTIDQKVYYVGQDIQSVTGSAADILRNIPSIDVDMDGNVSIRGDPNVQVLIDGHTSGMMGVGSRADILSQLPADSIERIEVIAVPSAKYKPDGTGGVINLVLKKKHGKSPSGTLKLTVGNDNRYGAGLNGNYNKGPLTVTGLINVRKDDRVRIATDHRTYIDPATGLPATAYSVTTETTRPLMKIAQLQVEDQVTKDDKVTQTLDYTEKIQHRDSDEFQENTIGGSQETFDRLRVAPERDTDAETHTTYQHDFGRQDNSLTAEVRWEHHTVTAGNHYADSTSPPPSPATFETTKIFIDEPSTELSIAYVNAFSATTKLELGLDRSEDISRNRVEDASLDPLSGLWLNNPSITSAFTLDQVVTAFYATYRERFGRLSAMVGVRAENTLVDTDQVTISELASESYVRLFPSSHLAYDISDKTQWVFDFSERIHRPEADDLDPFPQYQDPYSLFAGNPHLLPEEAHSFDTGWQYRSGDTTCSADFFYKYAYDGFSTVSRYINSATLLTTMENVASTRSGGMEASADFKPWASLALNASGSLYDYQLDASNLGLVASQQTFAWNAKASADYSIRPDTLFQLSATYSGKRLTAQGYRLPSFVANIGFKHEMLHLHLTVVVTVADLFNTLRDETILRSATLMDHSVHRRNSRTFSAGIVYAFGNPITKKTDSLQYDNSP